MTPHAPMITQHPQMHSGAMSSGLGSSLADALAHARAPLLFGVRAKLPEALDCRCVARAVNVANAQPAAQGVANVSPIFTWVRLAQRIPVRIHIDEMPPGVVLSAGMTATVEITVRDRDRGA
jgi:hypothetical protein